MSDRYMEDVVVGNALWTEADDYVARWHESNSNEPLHDFLGMSWDEYALWTERPETLRLIVAAHERGEAVESLLSRTDEFAVAARGLAESEAETVRAWLRETGRLT